MDISGLRDFYQNKLAYFLAVSLALWFIAVRYFALYPPPGVYIAVLAATAVFISNWPPKNHLTKIAWAVVFVGLMFLEINTIYKANAVYAKQQKGHEEQLKQILSETKRGFDTQISRLENILNTIVGGDSYCYLLMGNDLTVSSSIKSWEPMYLHVGKYQLYDVTADITDLQANPQFSKKNDINFNLGDIPVGGGGLINPKMECKPALKHSYWILWWARNGSWNQRLIFVYHNQMWHQATRVEKAEGNQTKILFEYVPSDFPRNRNGEVDWYGN